MEPQYETMQRQQPAEKYVPTTFEELRQRLIENEDLARRLEEQRKLDSKTRVISGQDDITFGKDGLVTLEEFKRRLKQREKENEEFVRRLKEQQKVTRETLEIMFDV